MSTRNLRHFMAAARDLHFAHAARAEGVSRATVIASVKELEDELGYPLFDYSAATTVLTPAGRALFDKTSIEWAKSAAAAKASAPAPGGKAKASKGKGRAPAVKGVRRVGRPRQGR
jgi:DNA-binding transcriptional LysR family regulator